MIFYKAITVVQKPFIHWNSVALSVDEAIELEVIDDPLVLPEELLPDIEFGICRMKIVGGALVNRTEAEMLTAANEYEEMQPVISQVLQSRALKTDFFPYDSHKFPMNETARLYYQGIQHIPGNYDVLDMSGEIYALATANNAAFLSAYFTRLIAIVKP